MTYLLDGRALAKEVRQEIATRVQACTTRGTVPRLGVVLVGDHPASQVYVRNKTKACQEVGIGVVDQWLPATASPETLVGLLQAWNHDATIHGILVQLPLPLGWPTDDILQTISPHKDVDGLLPENAGHLWQGHPRFIPCTPLGIMRLLQAAKVSLAGAQALVVGRSNLVGKPMAALLLAADATVTLAHSKTKHLSGLVQQADVVIAAVGYPHLIQGEWIQQGATVIDVGINRLPDGTLVGDVVFETAYARAAAITPVPGGVGPMTIAMLLQNTVWAAEQTLV